MARKNPLPVVPVVLSAVAETPAVAEAPAVVETPAPAPAAEVVDNLWLYRGLEWQATKLGVTLPTAHVTDEDRGEAAAIVATWEERRQDKVRRAQAGEEVKGEVRTEPFGQSTLDNAARHVAMRRIFASIPEAEIRAARKAPTAASFRRHLGLEVARATTRTATPAPAAKVGSTTGAVAARRGTQSPAATPASGSPAVGGLAALDLLLAQGVITADQHTAGMRALLSA